MTFIRISIVVMFVSLLVGLTFIFVNPDIRSKLEFQKKNILFTYNEYIDSFKLHDHDSTNILFSSAAVAYTVPVLVYHGLTEDSSVYSISQNTFDEHLLKLYQAGYKTITLEQLDKFLKADTPVPKNSFIITFDDGRRDSFYQSDSILKKYGYSAVMFVPGVILNSDDFKSTYYLDKNDLKIMKHTGRWEIGSHGMQLKGGFINIDENGTTGQFLSNKMWLPAQNRIETNEEYSVRVENELKITKTLIEEKIDTPVIAFSYPFGDYGQDSINAKELATSTIAKAVSANYQLAFQQVRPINGLHVGVQSSDNQYFLSRIEPKNEINNWDSAKLLEHIESAEIKSMPISDITISQSDWKTTWGGYSFESNMLTMKATENSEGAFSFIDGTFTWSDYILAADVNWKSGSHVLLVGRIANMTNYVQCSFSENMLRIELLRDDDRIILNEIKRFTDFSKDSHKLAVAIKGDKVTCYVDGVGVIVSSVEGVIPQKGAVGVKIWDQTVQTSEITINSFAVDEYTPENLTRLVTP